MLQFCLFFYFHWDSDVFHWEFLLGFIKKEKKKNIGRLRKFLKMKI